MFKKIYVFALMLVFFSCQKKESILTYNIMVMYDTLNPKLVKDQSSMQVVSMINEGLLSFKNNSYDLRLAKSIKERKKSFEITIRDDIYWSDGHKITVDDFILGFREALKKETAAYYAYMLYPIKNAREYNSGNLDENELGVRKINDKTFVIDLEQETPYFKYILTLPISYPLPSHIYDKTYGIENNVLSSSAFLLNDFNENEATLIKNNRYYDDVKIDKIKLVAINNYQVVNNLIKNQELDITRVEPSAKNIVKSDNLTSYFNERIWFFEYNYDNKILLNDNFREAISLAVNKKEYVEKIKEDGSKIANYIIPLSFIDRNITEYRYDNNLAKEKMKMALEELGMKNSDINLVFLAGNSDPEIKEANYIQEVLRKELGINLNVITMSYRERLNLTKEKKFDITLNTWSPKYYDASAMLTRWYNKDKFIPYLENVIYLFENAQNSSDLKKRNEEFLKLEKILVDKNIITPIYFSIENLYIRENIYGIKINNISNILDFKKGYID